MNYLRLVETAKGALALGAEYFPKTAAMAETAAGTLREAAVDAWFGLRNIAGVASEGKAAGTVAAAVGSEAKPGAEMYESMLKAYKTEKVNGFPMATALKESDEATMAKYSLAGQRAEQGLSSTSLEQNVVGDQLKILQYGQHGETEAAKVVKGPKIYQGLGEDEASELKYWRSLGTAMGNKQLNMPRVAQLKGAIEETAPGQELALGAEAARSPIQARIIAGTVRSESIPPLAAASANEIKVGKDIAVPRYAAETPELPRGADGYVRGVPFKLEEGVYNGDAVTIKRFAPGHAAESRIDWKSLGGAPGFDVGEGSRHISALH